jgi:hypothetical protein
MSKERYNQIIKEAYEKYHQENKKVMYLTFLLEEEFIRKIKTDSEFSQKWGIQIEERELSVKERLFFINKSDEEYEKALANKEQYESIGLDFELALSSRMNDLNIPTRIITLAYKNETIECYEN